MQHRTDARHQHIRACAPTMTIQPRRRARDPLTATIRQSRFAIRALRPLHARERTLLHHARHKTDVQIMRRLRNAMLGRQHLNRNTCCAQLLHALTRHQRIRIQFRHHHTRHPRHDQSMCARRRAPIMTAWLQRHIRRRSRRVMTALLRVAYRHHLRMRLPDRLRMSLPDDLIVLDQHATDARIGRTQTDGVVRQF